MFWFDPSIYVCLALLFGIAAQFRAMGGSASLRRVLAALETKVGLLFAVVVVACVFSPLVLNDVVVLVLTPVLIAYGGDDPRAVAPLVVAEITFANIASALTPFGNPQNILLWQASGVSAAAFVARTCWPLILSGVIAAVTLLPFTSRRAKRPEERGPITPVLYLCAVAAIILLGGLFDLPNWASLFIAFAVALPATYRILPEMAREFDVKSLVALYAFVSVVAVIAYFAAGRLGDAARAAASGTQPYSALFIGGLSALIGNVPATQLVVSLSSVSHDAASRLEVQAGLAGNLGPVASFANILALTMLRRAGLPLKRTVLLQVAVGVVAFLPAFL
ncbi:MAG: SLC13 family permease [Gemmatimonadaceae bacterium]